MPIDVAEWPASLFEIPWLSPLRGPESRSRNPLESSVGGKLPFGVLPSGRKPPAAVLMTSHHQTADVDCFPKRTVSRSQRILRAGFVMQADGGRTDSDNSSAAYIVGSLGTVLAVPCI